MDTTDLFLSLPANYISKNELCRTKFRRVKAYPATRA
jgi:hypothetical protein